MRACAFCLLCALPRQRAHYQPRVRGNAQLAAAVVLAATLHQHSEGHTLRLAAGPTAVWIILTTAIRAIAGSSDATIRSASQRNAGCQRAKRKGAAAGRRSDARFAGKVLRQGCVLAFEFVIHLAGGCLAVGEALFLHCGAIKDIICVIPHAILSCVPQQLHRHAHMLRRSAHDFNTTSTRDHAMACYNKLQARKDRRTFFLGHCWRLGFFVAAAAVVFVPGAGGAAAFGRLAGQQLRHCLRAPKPSFELDTGAQCDY